MTDFPTVWPEQAIITHTRNTRGRDLVIGDLHGHFDTLDNALEQLAFDARSDRLFSVGDLIDRSPRSEATLEWIASRRMHAVRGNHEQTMVKALTLEPGRLFNSAASGHWLANGGGWWFGFEGLDETARPVWRESPHPKRAEEWLAALRIVPYLRTIETPAGRVGIVHTGDGPVPRLERARCRDARAGGARAKRPRSTGRGARAQCSGNDRTSSARAPQHPIYLRA